MPCRTCARTPWRSTHPHYAHKAPTHTTHPRTPAFPSPLLSHHWFGCDVYAFILPPPTPFTTTPPPPTHTSLPFTHTPTRTHLPRLPRSFPACLLAGGTWPWHFMDHILSLSSDIYVFAFLYICATCCTRLRFMPCTRAHLPRATHTAFCHARDVWLPYYTRSLRYPTHLHILRLPHLLYTHHLPMRAQHLAFTPLTHPIPTLPLTLPFTSAVSGCARTLVRWMGGGGWLIGLLLRV